MGVTVAVEIEPVQVLQELASDKALERFRIEYEKLYKALKKSHGNQGFDSSWGHSVMLC